MNIPNLNILDNIMSKVDCLNKIDLELANTLRDLLEKLNSHFYVDALELFAKAYQLYECIDSVCTARSNDYDRSKYKSLIMYEGVRGQLCDLLAGRKSIKDKDDVDEALEEGRKEIRIVPGRDER